MSALLALTLQAASAPVGETQNFDLARVPPSDALRPSLSLCPPESDAEVTVCGRRSDRYRLPLPVERDPVADNRAADLPGGMAALIPAGRCGPFAGERACTRREAAAYGYGQGRDPLTLLLKLGKHVVDGE